MASQSSAALLPVRLPFPTFPQCLPLSCCPPASASSHDVATLWHAAWDKCGACRSVADQVRERTHVCTVFGYCLPACLPLSQFPFPHHSHLMSKFIYVMVRWMRPAWWPLGSMGETWQRQLPHKLSTVMFSISLSLSALRQFVNEFFSHSAAHTPCSTQFDMHWLASSMNFGKAKKPLHWPRHNAQGRWRRPKKLSGSKTVLNCWG